MTALFAALIMVPALRQWALQTRTLDVPDERKVHRVAVPRIGGIAIYVSFLFAVLIFMPMADRTRGLMAGGLVLFVTGLVDDIYGISPRRKLLGQVVGTVITMGVSGIYIHTLGNLLGTGELTLSPWLGIPFTLFAVVGVINAINLIDGLDGLAGGVSAIALTAFMVLGYHDGNVKVIMICAALLGALLGFLKYNFFPARIFMGDTGSLTVGFVLAFAALYLTQAPEARIPPVTPLIVLGLPIIDTVWVMSSRLLRRQSPFSPDMTHVHHKFLSLGLEHRYTVVMIYGISVAWALFAALFHEMSQMLQLAVYVGVSVCSYLAIRWLTRRGKNIPFMGNDSSDGIRESVLYRRAADTVAAFWPLLALLLAAYLVMALIAAAQVGAAVAELMLILAGGGVALFLLTRSMANPYLLAMFYVSSMAIAFMIARYGTMPLMEGISLKNLADLLLTLMVPLAASRFLFRRPHEFFLEGIDYLLLGVTIFLCMVVPQLTGIINLNGVLVRGVTIFCTLKVLSVQGPRMSRSLAIAILLTMLAIVVRGYGGW